MCRLIEILGVLRFDRVVLSRFMMSGELAPVLKDHTFTDIEIEKTLQIQGVTVLVFPGQCRKNIPDDEKSATPVNFFGAGCDNPNRFDRYDKYTTGF